jgi:hypothetical protein
MAIYGRSAGKGGLSMSTGQTETYHLRSREFRYRENLQQNLKAAPAVPGIKVFSPWEFDEKECGIHANELVFFTLADAATLGRRAFVDSPAVFSTYLGLPLTIPTTSTTVTVPGNILTGGSEADKKAAVEAAVGNMVADLRFAGVSMAKEELKRPSVAEDESVGVAVRIAGIISTENTCAEATYVGDLLCIDQEHLVESALAPGKRPARVRRGTTRKVFMLKRLGRGAGSRMRALRLRGTTELDRLITAAAGANTAQLGAIRTEIKKAIEEVPILRVVKGAAVGEMMDVLVL